MFARRARTGDDLSTFSKQKARSCGPFAPMGDTGLELAPGTQLRADTACQLLSGALRSAQIRSLKYHGKYHGESVPDGTYFLRSMNSAGERTGGTASASCRRCASPETMHCAPATRASATR
jgi:hypothetical protein